MPLFFVSLVDQGSREFLGGFYSNKPDKETAVEAAALLLPAHQRNCVSALAVQVPTGSRGIPANCVGRLLSRSELEQMGPMASLGEWHDKHGPPRRLT